MFKKGEKIGIVVLSNGINNKKRKIIDNLILEIKKIGLIPVLSDYIYCDDTDFCDSGKQKAEGLIKFYQDKEIKGIFDISGGDLANEVLPYLNFEIINNNYKPFFGYSDLTTVINAIFKNTNKYTYLYQIKNIISENKEKQIYCFRDSILNGNNSLFDFSYTFIKGQKMQGVVIGGNIRCFLKLAGTKYMPDFKNKILFIESRSGKSALMASFLNQLKQMNVFENINGIILGTFTQMEKEKSLPSIEDLVIDITKEYDLPIAKTKEIGHGSDSKCIIIGKEYILGK